MALPRISRGLALPSGRTTTVTPTDAETDGDDDETREVPIPVPPDVSEEEVQEAADAAAEALPEDTEAVVGERDPEPEPSPEPDDMQRTIEQLRSTGDPNEVERTPVLESGNIDVAPDEWELGFPLQGIPRLAAVVNLNYVYNEERERWERQEPFRNPGVGAPVARLGRSNATSVGSFSSDTVSFEDTPIQRSMEVTDARDAIIAPKDGLYHVEGSVLLTNFSNDAIVGLEVSSGFVDTLKRVIVPTNNNAFSPEEAIAVSGVIEARAGNEIKLEVSVESVGSVDYGGTSELAYLSARRI